jgi:hypothetical protein
MKLIAHIFQQKWIGEMLGRKLWVRSAVGINSPLMKAVRYLLEQPGLSLGKVMILCGGPDWPTSVLCGILRCPLPQILLGLSPICTYSFTSTLAGAFQLKIDDGAEWASAATVFLIVSTLTQVVYGCIALYLIDKIRREKADELAKYPDDADVLHHVLCWTCEAAIIKMPLGWISLVALIYGSFALWMFERWANKQAKNQPVDDVKAHDELTGAGHVWPARWGMRAMGSTSPTMKARGGSSSPSPPTLMCASRPAQRLPRLRRRGRRRRGRRRAR